MLIRLFFLIIIITSSCTAPENQGSKIEEDPQEITLVDLYFKDVQGNTFTGKDLLGKPVFVHFWATWCGPCIKEMPDIEKIMGKYPEMHFIFPSDEEMEDIIKFRNSRSFPFRFVQLSKGLHSAGVTALPTTYIFDKEGKLKEVITGSRDWSSAESQQILSTLTNL